MHLLPIASLLLMSMAWVKSDQQHQHQQQKVVMCFFGSWARHRHGEGRFDVENIDPSLCTHLTYAFASLNNVTYTIEAWDTFHDLPDNGGNAAYQKFTKLKQENKNLTTLLSIGGTLDGSTKYSEMVSTAARRKTFIESAVGMIAAHGFDGLDINWEYPGGRDGLEAGLPDDKENFALLLQELREEFHKHGFMLTAAVSGFPEVIEHAYDIPVLAKTLDFINLMSFDYHSWWGGHGGTGHHSPLNALPEEEADPEHPGHNRNTNWSVNTWIAGGASKHQLLVGFGTYGRGFKLADAKVNGFYAPAVDAIAAGNYTEEPGMWSFKEYCEKMLAEKDLWTVVRDPHVVSPYAYKGDDWIGFEDEISAHAKAQYIVDQGLGGVFVWSLDNDDFNGACGKGKFPLISAMNKVLKPNAAAPVPNVPVGPAPGAPAVPNAPVAPVAQNAPNATAPVSRS